MNNQPNNTGNFIYKDIDKGSSLKVIYLSGLGLDIRRQREGFLRRFSLTHNVSYMALDYTKYIMDNPALSKERIQNAFIKTKNILEQTKEEKLILLGVCFGGLMGIKIMELMPDRIAGSILLSPAYETPTFPMINSAENFLHNRIHGLKKHHADPKILNKLITFKEVVISAFKVHSPKEIKSNYQGHISIFHGQNDNFIPVENSHHVKKVLKNSHCHLHIIKKNGHSMNADFEMKRPLRILKTYLEKMSFGRI